MNGKKRFTASGRRTRTRKRLPANELSENRLLSVTMHGEDCPLAIACLGDMRLPDAKNLLDMHCSCPTISAESWMGSALN